MVACSLGLVGITERLVSGFLGRPCKCAQRREKLNSLGRKIGIGVLGTPVRGNN